MEYRLAPSLRLFLDGSHSSYRKQVGIAGANSSSFWIFEMTGYTTNEPHFDDDAFMYMDTTGFRLGAKLVLPGSGIQPWIGAGVGYYRWDAAYVTGDRSSTWGSDGGYAWGLTYLGGVDMGQRGRQPHHGALSGWCRIRHAPIGRGRTETAKGCPGGQPFP